MYHLPNGWEEVSAKKAILIAHLLVSPKVDNFYNRLAALQVLSGIPFFLIKAMNPEQQHQLCDLLAFIDKPFVKPLKDVITVGGKKFYGPAENLRNTSGIEYHHCDYFLRKLNAAVNKEQVINQIIAGIYRPAGEGSSPEDPRGKFDTKKVDFNLKYIQKMPPEDKIMILTWFIACHIEVQEKYKPMFTGEGSEEKRESLGILGLLFSIAETGIFGDFDKTCHTNVHTLFTFWTKKILDSKQ